MDRRKKLIFNIYVVAVILFASSFKTLNPLEMALARNNLSSTVDKSRVYLAGRYFLGLGKEFIVYPVESQQLTLVDLEGQTKDKQSVTFSVQLQYQLIPEELITLYEQRQQGYDAYFKIQIEDKIKEVCVLYETIPDFYAKRNEIGAAMQTVTEDLLNENGAKLMGFQLLKIGLRDSTEQKIIETLVAEQKETTETILQSSTVVRAEKTKFSIAAEAKVKIITSEAESLGISTLANAKALAFELVTGAQSGRLSAINTGLSLTSASKLLAYVWYDGFKKIDHKTNVVIGADGVSQSELTS